jgi:hypothetical protein
MVDVLNVKLWRPGPDLNRTSSASFGLLELLLSDVFTDEELGQIFSRNTSKISTPKYKKVLLKNKDRRLVIRFYG